MNPRSAPFQARSLASLPASKQSVPSFLHMHYRIKLTLCVSAYEKKEDTDFFQLRELSRCWFQKSDHGERVEKTELYEQLIYYFF